MIRRWLPLLAVVALGAALRIVGIDRAPPGLYYDEAANGIDALYVLQGEWPFFFVGNQGREPLHIYLTALATALVGPGWLAVRLPSLLAGIATIPAAYLLGREVGGRRVGLIAAALLATTYWHVHLSRLGFRAVWVPLAVALALGLMLRAYRRGSQRTAALAGLAIGLGLYTYIAARLLPLVAVAVALLALRLWRPPAHVLMTPLTVAAVVAGPLAAFFLDNPRLFWSRADAASGGPLTVLDRLSGALGIFLWTGDVQARHNLPERPVFDWLTGAFFLVGVVLVLRRPTLPSLSVFLSVVAMLLPQALASGEPHFLRAVGVMPAAQVVAAIGLAAIPRATMIAALLFGTAITARDYFMLWAPARGTYLSFESEARDAARLLCLARDQRPVAAGSRIYRDVATYYLGAPCPPDLFFEHDRAIVLPPEGGTVLIPPDVLTRPDPRALLAGDALGVTVGGAFRVEAYRLPRLVVDPAAPTLELGWRVLGPAPAGLYQFAHVVQAGDQPTSPWAVDDVAPYPSAQWRGGEVGRTTFRLGLQSDAPNGAYFVLAGLYQAPGGKRLPIVDAAGRPIGDSLRLGPFKLWRPEQARPRPLRPLADFGDGIAIVGVDAPARAAPRDPVRVRLTWWAPGPTERPMTVFAHLLDASRTERANADGQPAAGSNPTHLWQPGELVEEVRTLVLPPDAPPGRYALEVGLYDPSTGQRLRLTSAPDRIGDGALVAWIEVG